MVEGEEEALYGGPADQHLRNLLANDKVPPHVELMTVRGITRWLTGVVHAVENDVAVVITRGGPVLINPRHAHVVHKQGGVAWLGVMDHNCDISPLSVVCVPDDSRESDKEYFPLAAYREALPN